MGTGGDARAVDLAGDDEQVRARFHLAHLVRPGIRRRHPRRAYPGHGGAALVLVTDDPSTPTTGITHGGDVVTEEQTGGSVAE